MRKWYAPLPCRARLPSLPACAVNACASYARLARWRGRPPSALVTPLPTCTTQQNFCERLNDNIDKAVVKAVLLPGQVLPSSRIARSSGGKEVTAAAVGESVFDFGQPALAAMVKRRADEILSGGSVKARLQRAGRRDFSEITLSRDFPAFCSLLLFLATWDTAVFILQPIGVNALAESLKSMVCGSSEHSKIARLTRHSGLLEGALPFVMATDIATHFQRLRWDS